MKAQSTTMRKLTWNVFLGNKPEPVGTVEATAQREATRLAREKYNAANDPTLFVTLKQS